MIPMRFSVSALALLSLAAVACASAEPELRGTAADPADVAPMPPPAATALQRGFDPARWLPPAAAVPAGAAEHDHHHHGGPPASAAPPASAPAHPHHHAPGAPR
jgi:hypothetical protein